MLASAAALVPASVGAFYLFVVQPFGGGVAAELRLADGTEYKLTQTYNNSWSEPYNVSFHSRRPGEDWKWHYVDHEAGIWKRVEITHDTMSDQVIVTERGKKRAVLDRGKSTFWIDKRDFRGTNPISTLP